MPLSAARRRAADIGLLQAHPWRLGGICGIGKIMILPFLVEIGRRTPYCYAVSTRHLE
jgi:hypothetical protein